MKKLFVKAVLLVITSLAAVACTSCNKGDEAVAPVVGSAVASEITATSAKITVTIVSDGGSTITKQGVVNGLNTYTSDVFGSKIFSTTLSDLSPNTVYIIRGFATNTVGTGYSDVQFTTATLPTIKDFDGNNIPYGTIGAQIWTLKDWICTHNDQDGSVIPEITVNSVWANTTQGGLCYYNNDHSNKSVLYNNYAAVNPKFAPKGWHVATHADWVALANYLGGYAIAGGHIKATTGWPAPNTGADNSTGFSAIRTGNRYQDGTFADIDHDAGWISVEIPAGNVAYVTYNDAALQTQYVYTANLGAAIRLVKDN